MTLFCHLRRLGSQGTARATWVWALSGMAWLTVGSIDQVKADLPLNQVRSLLASELMPTPDSEILGSIDENNIEGILRQLDPFAAFYRDGKADRDTWADGSWAGIGAELLVRDGGSWLLPYQRGPLAKVGFFDLVELLEIDGTRTAGLEVDDLARMLAGESGSTANLLVVPAGTEKETRVIVKRAPYTPLDVELWKRGELPVLRITEFRGGRTRTALETTLNMVPAGASRIVIDLRYAGGGDLFEAIDAASLLVERGSLLGVLHGRQGEPRPVYSVAHSLQRPPVALLVGPDTASAAEIFAGILRVHRRAVLVGRPTFGKCSSQTERRLRDGSVLRFTNLEFRFPDGSTCSVKGLKPDVEVDQDVLASMDSLLDEVGKLPVDAFDPIDNREGL